MILHLGRYINLLRKKAGTCGPIIGHQHGGATLSTALLRIDLWQETAEEHGRCIPFRLDWQEERVERTGSGTAKGSNLARYRTLPREGGIWCYAVIVIVVTLWHFDGKRGGCHTCHN